MKKTLIAAAPALCASSSAMAQTAVVAATHDDALAGAVADEVWEVAGGRVTTGRPAPSSAPAPVPAPAPHPAADDPAVRR